MTEEQPHRRGPSFEPYPLPAAQMAPGAGPPRVEPSAAEPPGPRRPPDAATWSLLLGAAGVVGFVTLAVVLDLGFVKGALVPLLLGASAVALGYRALGSAGVPVAGGKRARALWGRALGYAAMTLSGVAAGVALVGPPAPPAPVPLDSVVPGPVDPGLPGGEGRSGLVGVPSTPGDPVLAAPTATGTLTGRVTAADGSAVAGATVTVTRSKPGDTSDAPACPLTKTTTTGRDGTYSLTLCQLGDNLGYAVRVTKGSLVASTPLAYVNSGRITTYSVRLP